MKIKEYKSGAYVSLEHGATLSLVKLYSASGDLMDKIRCDTRRSANEYFRAFCAIAKNQ